MKSCKITLTLCALLCAALLLGAGCAAQETPTPQGTEEPAAQQTPDPTPDPTPAANAGEEGTPPYDRTALDLNGAEQSTLALAAEHDLTLVNFWATWCGPCVSEMPGLQSLYESLSAEGSGYNVGFLGIWLDTENAQDYASVIEYTGVKYPIWQYNATLAEGVSLQYIPASIFLDGEGRIVGKPIVGAMNEDAWLAEIEARLDSLGISYGA